MVISLMMVVGIFFQPFFLSTSALAETPCFSKLGSCDYYICREQLHPCEEEGYYLRFGKNYCEKSVNSVKPNLTPRGQQWIDKAAECLQREVELKIIVDADCGEVKRLAIQGHARCYLDSGFCDLPLGDQVQIIYSIRNAVWVQGVIGEGLNVLRECVGASE